MTKKTAKRIRDLEQREKSELIAIIELMLQQQPDLEWILRTSLPGTGKHTISLDANPYRRQIEAAVSAVIAHDRDRSYREALRNTLATLQKAADDFAEHEDYAAALTLYEVLASEAIRHFWRIETGYLIFPSVLESCIDGLDRCFAEAEEDQETRQHVLIMLLKMYLFSLSAPTDVGEDIPDLLIGNTTPAERQMLAGRIRDEMARLSKESARDEHHDYFRLLRRLEKEGL